MKQPYIFAFALLLGCGCGNSLKPDMDADAHATFAAHPDSLEISLSVEPANNSMAIRSVTFLACRYSLVGNPIMAQDGTVWNPVAFMEQEEALGMIKAASASGVLARARKYYSVRTTTENGPGPPSHAVNLDQPLPDNKRETIPPPRLMISFVASDNYWYSYYETTLPWDRKSRAILRRFANALSEANRSHFERMLAEEI